LFGVPPEPASIVVIEIGSDANAPTISHSGLCFANPSGSAGYLLSIFLSGLPDPVLYAFPSFA
jgi:hypothetical protein